MREKDLISKTAMTGISCQDNPSVIDKGSTAGITLVALVVTIVFSYDEKIKRSNSKGFLLTAI